MIVLGVQAFAATPEAAARQAGALRAAVPLRGVRLVNLQWPDRPQAVHGWRTLSALRDDSVRAAGREGPRKPIAREVFDLLVREAGRAGAAWFGFMNSDIRVTGRVLDFVRGFPGEAVAVCRTECDGGVPTGVTTAGVDAFFVRREWWMAHRRHFRPYIVGEPVWDNVYTALLMRLGEAVILDDAGWVFHERHPARWRGSPFAEYTRWLAALDRPHFTRWAKYHWLTERSPAADTAARRAIARAVFRAPDGNRGLQALRTAGAGLRYLLRG